MSNKYYCECPDVNCRKELDITEADVVGLRKSFPVGLLLHRRTHEDNIPEGYKERLHCPTTIMIEHIPQQKGGETDMSDKKSTLRTVAQKKIQAEIRDKAVAEIETKLRELAAAKRVTRKVEKELVELEKRLVEDLKEIDEV